MLGTRHDDVVILTAPSETVPRSDPYCAKAGARVLEAIVAQLGSMSHSAVVKDDSWASARIGSSGNVKVSIVWVPAESGDRFTWALQFSENRGCLDLFYTSRRVSADALGIRQAVFAAAHRAPGLLSVRWIDALEFRRVY